MAESDPASTGLQFGRFKVLRTLGGGGMGQVYLAEDPVIGRKVAIKVVKADPGLETEELEELHARFEREFQSAGTLSHPNIVTVYDVGKEGEDTFIAMEYLPGESWGDILKSDRELTFSEVVGFATKICSALDYAHANGIVHRDIKPANILLARNGEPKVTDFGVAKLMSTNLTRTGTVVGTPSYMSPEQITGRQVSGASDQFSIGVILYQMFTHELPFVGENPTTILYKIVHESLPPPTEKNPTLPRAVDGVLRRALEKAPEDRFSSCGELASALREALGLVVETLDFDLDHQATVERHPRTPTETQKKTRKSRLVAAFAAAAVIAAIVVLVSYRDALFPPPEGAAEEVVEGPTTVSKLFTISGESSGAAIWKDGEDTGLLTPATITLEGIVGDEVMLELQRDNQTVAQASLLLAVDMPEDWQPIEEMPAERFAVTSSPQGAQVYLNEVLVDGTTPLEIELSASEAYQLQVVLPEYHTQSVAFAFPDDLDAGIRQSRRFFFELQPRIPPGRIVLESAYPVRVDVAGESFGPQLTHDISIRPGTYEVRLQSKDVFLDETRTLEIESQAELNLTLPPAVDLRVAANPGNCRVFVNGRFIDETPLSLSLVPSNYEFRFEWPGRGESRSFFERVTRDTTHIFHVLE